MPLLSDVQAFADLGVITGASGRNWLSYGNDVKLPAGFTQAQQALLSDPQTSGGLLVSCNPVSVDAVLEIFKKHQFMNASVIGHMTAQAAHLLTISN